MPVPPYRPCAVSDDNVVPVLEVSRYEGSQSGGGKTPVECSGSLKTVSVKFFYSDITTVSIIYDDYRRPRRGAPAAPPRRIGNKYSKETPYPLFLGEALRRVSFKFTMVL